MVFPVTRHCNSSYNLPPDAGTYPVSARRYARPSSAYSCQEICCGLFSRLIPAVSAMGSSISPVIPGRFRSVFLSIFLLWLNEGTTTVQDGTKYIVIEASGDWELTKKK